MMKQASMQHANRYAFTVHLLNGAKKPDLKRSFIRVMDIKPIQNKLILEDGTAWELYCEPDVLDCCKASEQAAYLGLHCIVSFQVFYNGEQIAVARMFRSRRAAEDIITHTCGVEHNGCY